MLPPNVRVVRAVGSGFRHLHREVYFHVETPDGSSNWNPDAQATASHCNCHTVSVEAVRLHSCTLQHRARTHPHEGREPGASALLKSPLRNTRSALQVSTGRTRTAVGVDTCPEQPQWHPCSFSARHCGQQQVLKTHVIWRLRSATGLHTNSGWTIVLKIHATGARLCVCEAQYEKKRWVASHSMCSCV